MLTCNTHGSDTMRGVKKECEKVRNVVTIFNG